LAPGQGAEVPSPSLYERSNAGWQIMKVMIKSAWGSDESTKAAFAFLHANAFAAAGHEVQIFLLGEAVNLMKNETMNSVTPVGWPPLSQIMRETIGHKIPLNI
jgi:predicted peroxiredoxin